MIVKIFYSEDLRLSLSKYIKNRVFQYGSSMISLGKPRLLLLPLFPFLQPSPVHLTFQHQVSLKRGMRRKHFPDVKLCNLCVYCNVCVFCEICQIPYIFLISTVALYLCSTKTREVLGNPSPTPKRFPETRDF